MQTITKGKASIKQAYECPSCDYVIPLVPFEAHE